MKRSFALALGLASLTVAVSASAGTEVGHFVSDGEFASFYGYQDDAYLSISVNRGGSGGDQQTWLDIYSGSCTYDATSYRCTGLSGWGIIPNGDFDVQGSSGNAALSTDLSNVQAYAYEYSCDYETWSCSFSELPAPSGTLSLSWQKNSYYRESSNGRYESDYLNYKYISQGRQEYSSANVSGMLGDQPISSGDGSVGTSRGRSISIVKN